MINKLKAFESEDKQINNTEIIHTKNINLPQELKLLKIIKALGKLKRT